jgi:hypothetical protein
MVHGAITAVKHRRRKTASRPRQDQRSRAGRRPCGTGQGRPPGRRVPEETDGCENRKGGEQKNRRFLEDEDRTRDEQRIDGKEYRRPGGPRKGRRKRKEQEECGGDPEGMKKGLEDRGGENGRGPGEKEPSPQQEGEKRGTVDHGGDPVLGEALPRGHVPRDLQVPDRVVTDFWEGIGGNEQQARGEGEDEQRRGENGKAASGRSGFRLEECLVADGSGVHPAASGRGRGNIMATSTG